MALPLAGFEPARPLREQLTSGARGVAVAFFVLSFGYLLNGLTDRKMDEDVTRNSLVELEGRERSIIGISCGLAAAALAVAGCGPWPAFAAAAVCVASGWIYSAGPRLKSVPVVGSLLNVTNFTPLLFVGIAGVEFPLNLLELGVVFSVLLLQNQLLHEAADARADRRGGVHTTFLFLGQRAAAAVAFVLGLAIAFAGFGIGQKSGPALAFVAAILALPCCTVFPIWLYRRGSEHPAMGVARVAHRRVALVLGATLGLASLGGR